MYATICLRSNICHENKILTVFKLSFIELMQNTSLSWKNLSNYELYMTIVSDIPCFTILRKQAPNKSAISINAVRKGTFHSLNKNDIPKGPLTTYTKFSIPFVWNWQAFLCLKYFVLCGSLTKQTKKILFLATCVSLWINFNKNGLTFC